MAKTSSRKKTKSAKTTRKKKAASKSSARKTTKASARKKVSTTKRKSKAKKSTTRKKKATRPTMKKSSTSTKTKKSATTTTKKKPTKKTGTKVAADSSRKSKAKSSAKAAGAGAKSSPKLKRARSVAEAASTVSADDKGYVFINGRRVRMISTQGFTPKKQSRPVAVEESPEEAEITKPLKTRLSKKELNHYQNILLEKRAEIVGDLNAMESAALRSNGGDVSHMPIHMADIGTDTYDQDFTLGLAEAERKQLREIDDALQRIVDKTYGVCLMTGNDIPKARLDAKPWAKYTIEAARIVESQSQR